MPKSLADGHTKLAILTTKPVNPAAPTVTELNAGINAACGILASDFLFSPTDSDKVAEKALCEPNNSNALGPTNLQAGFTIFRMFDEADGTPDLTEDALFQAVKVKGTEVWAYARKTGQLETEVWTLADEIYLGAHLLADAAQQPTDGGGYIKARVPFEPQAGWTYIAAAAGA